MSKIFQAYSNDESYRSRLFLFGGISGIAIGIGYVIITGAYTMAGFPLPTDSLSWINYLNGNFHIWWSIIWLSIITNLLYLPFAYAMYELMKKTHAGMLLISLSLFTLFVVLELSITWSRYPALLDLVAKYQSCSDGEMKSVYLAAIETVSAEFQTNVTTFYMIFVPSVATIFSSIALLQTKFTHKLIALIGLISGGCNAIASMGGIFIKPLGNLVVVGSFLVLFWFIGIGIALLKQRSKLIPDMSADERDNK